MHAMMQCMQALERALQLSAETSLTLPHATSHRAAFLCLGTLFLRQTGHALACKHLLARSLGIWAGSSCLGCERAFKSVLKKYGVGIASGAGIGGSGYGGFKILRHLFRRVAFDRHDTEYGAGYHGPEASPCTFLGKNPMPSIKESSNADLSGYSPVTHRNSGARVSPSRTGSARA